MSRVGGRRPLLVEEERVGPRSATARNPAGHSPQPTRQPERADRCFSGRICLRLWWFIVRSVRAILNRLLRLLTEHSTGYLRVKEKSQSDQRRDDVLHRMLRTSPQPKTGDKSLKNLKKKQGDESLLVKPLKELRESSAKSDPTDDPEALIECGKRNIQRD
jgi:hypothetical protein